MRCHAAERTEDLSVTCGDGNLEDTVPTEPGTSVAGNGYHRIAGLDHSGAWIAAVTAALRQMVRDRCLLERASIRYLHRIEHVAGTDDQLRDERIPRSADDSECRRMMCPETINQLVEDHLLSLLVLVVTGIQSPLCIEVIASGRLAIGGVVGRSLLRVFLGSSIPVADGFELGTIREQAFRYPAVRNSSGQVKPE
jgi:hypothetical protein